MDESLNQSKDQATLVMPMISSTCTCCSFSGVKRLFAIGSTIES